MVHKVDIIFANIFFILCMIMLPTTYAFNSEEHWAREEMNQLVEKSVFSATNEDFDPDDEATIEEIMKAINIILNIDLSNDSNNNLYLFHEQGYLLNITDLNSCMSREEMAIIVKGFFDDIEIDLDQTTTFLDDKEIEVWTKGTIAKLQEMNIFIGYPDMTFQPKNNITKAELATVIIRCNNYLANEITISKNEENVSKLEIGIFDYEKDNLIISPIEDSLIVNVGDTIAISISYSGDEWEDKLRVDIENPRIVTFHEELYQLEALKEGTTSMRFYLEDEEEEYSFEVVVE